MPAQGADWYAGAPSPEAPFVLPRGPWGAQSQDAKSTNCTDNCRVRLRRRRRHPGGPQDVRVDGRLRHVRDHGRDGAGHPARLRLRRVGAEPWRSKSTVLDDIGADAVKTGMSPACHYRSVASGNTERAPRVDPVMVAKGGDKLLRDDAYALKQRLFGDGRHAQPAGSRGWAA